MQIINQSIKQMWIYRALMNREWSNMGLATYNFDPEYSMEEIISNQQLPVIVEATAQPSPFSVQLQSYLER